MLCSECRAHLKKTGELPPLPASVPGTPSTPATSCGKNLNDSSYLFRPVEAESPSDSPSRMRTRNKAAKEQVCIIFYHNNLVQVVCVNDLINKLMQND